MEHPTSMSLRVGYIPGVQPGNPESGALVGVAIGRLRLHPPAIRFQSGFNRFCHFRIRFVGG
jgi:hypothetical protein